MSDLNGNSEHFTMEEYASSQIDKNYPSEVIVNKGTCPKSRGDGYQTLEFPHSGPFDVLNIDVASLCSVDKMRIDHLISELDKCRNSNTEIELQLSASKFENKTILNKFESCNTRHDDDKTILKLRLETETRELKELTTNTSLSLDILSDRISAWEFETSVIRDAIDELLDHKIHLQEEMNIMESKILLLTAEDSRINDTWEMKKLHLTKHKLKEDMMMIFTSDRDCQTEEIALS